MKINENLHFLIIDFQIFIITFVMQHYQTYREEEEEEEAEEEDDDEKELRRHDGKRVKKKREMSILCTVLPEYWGKLIDPIN